MTVTDANNQTATAQATVGQGSIVNFTLVASGISSNGAADGSASASNPSGGTAPYTYEWSNGATTAAITGLGPGSYTVTVTDADGCTAEGTANMFNPSP